MNSCLFYEQADIPELLKRFNPSVSSGELKRFDDWTRDFGEEGA